MNTKTIFIAPILAIAACTQTGEVSDQRYDGSKYALPPVSAVLTAPMRCPTAQDDFEGLHRTCGDRDAPAAPERSPRPVERPAVLCVLPEGC